MRNPDSLEVSAIALDIADETYDLTAAFPRDQRFELAAQMHRAAISIGSNIYEGCGRPTRKAFVAFLGVALGSASELRFHLRLARRRGFAAEHDIARMEKHLLHLIRKLARLIAANRGHSRIPLQSGRTSRRFASHVDAPDPSANPPSTQPLAPAAAPRPPSV
jgi:four helix bundle protein